MKTVTPEIIAWESRDGREHQAFGVDVKLGEGPDPLQFTLEDWIDRERE
jgi:hypothetical protein